MKRLVSFGAVLLFGVACSGPASEPPSTTQPETSPTTSEASAPADTTSTTSTTTPNLGPPDHVLTISGFSFGSDLHAKVGESVEVTNSDPISHTWTERGGLFNSGSLSGDRSFRYVFEEAGEYEVFCQIHTDMSGRVFVED